MILAPLAAVLTLAVSAGPAAAPVSPEVRARVDELLGVIDRPIRPESFRPLGAAGEAALAEVALSRDLSPWRARALEALAGLRAARAEEIHRKIASAPDEPRTVRRAAVTGLARLLPPARATAELRPILERDRDAAIRAAAAEALAASSPNEACTAVRAQVRREAEGDRARFGRAVASCEKRGR